MRCRPRRRQHGMAYLWLLSVLVPGALWLSLSISPLHPGAGVEQQRVASLLDARDRLLAYTTAYPWLYTGTGAGPGHFPCPDTDGFANSIEAQSTLRDDGPDPPCGTQAYAVGWLARRIVTGRDRRVLLHDLPQQRIVYVVDTRMINNPVNRIVNDIAPASQGPTAWLLLPAPRAGLTADRLARRVQTLVDDADDVATALAALARTEPVLMVTVSRAVWGEPMRLRVAEWLNWRLSPAVIVRSDDGLFDAAGRIIAKPHAHWFTRNHWPARVDWVVDDDCRTLAADCVWSVHLPPVTDAPGAPAMVARQRVRGVL